MKQALPTVMPENSRRQSSSDTSSVCSCRPSVFSVHPCRALLHHPGDVRFKSVGTGASGFPINSRVLRVWKRRQEKRMVGGVEKYHEFTLITRTWRTVLCFSTYSPCPPEADLHWSTVLSSNLLSPSSLVSLRRDLNRWLRRRASTVSSNQPGVCPTPTLSDTQGCRESDDSECPCRQGLREQVLGYVLCAALIVVLLSVHAVEMHAVLMLW
ncbi:hypothetical protein RRG08_063550 [Elysia crispata]|uniref:Uncharacterized protein n=1 Tax=Elysia crispata TaxID=231223 RepID=A0AAE0YP16_9GAST|nr:hypothetical protein RRG08_063550 [Elysia crispata]